MVKKVASSPVAVDVKAERELVVTGQAVLAVETVPVLAVVTPEPDELKLREEWQGAADVAAFTLRPQAGLVTMFVADTSGVRIDRHRSADLRFDRA